MWAHPATRRNRAVLAKEGISFVGPGRGEMAESGEAGEGRMAEPLEIVAAVEALLDTARNRWRERDHRHIRADAEPIDPVRYIANRSSGEQGHAIAAPLPGSAPMSGLSPGLWLFRSRRIETAHVSAPRRCAMRCEELLPGGCRCLRRRGCRLAHAGFVRREDQEGPGQCAARAEDGGESGHLAGVGHHARRPYLVVGFRRANRDLLRNASAKLKKEGADIVVATTSRMTAASDRAASWAATATV